MTRAPFRHLFLALVAAPLALGLAACGKDKGADAGLSGEPIAKIAPPAGKAWTDVVSKTPEGGYRMGNPDAPIKLVEYGSLSCPHCAHFAQEAFASLASDFVDSGRVSFEFRSFAIHPQDGAIASTAALGLRQVLEGSRPLFSLEYPCHSPTEQRWFVLNAAPVISQEFGAVISHVNVTAWRQPVSL